MFTTCPEMTVQHIQIAYLHIKTLKFTVCHELLFTAKLHGELGPTLGLRKSSSLESLQSAVQEVSMEEDGSHFWKPPNRGMVRGRGCNESFRAAVDRSYENSGMLSVAEAMEPRK